MTVAFEELVAQVPPYRLLLPVGWSEAPATAETAQRLVERGSGVMRAAHRPELDAEFRTLVRRAFAQLSAQNAIAVYLQDEVPADQVLPLSLIVSLRRAPEGGTLDDEVTRMFRSGGAQFLRDDRAIVRLETDRVVDGLDARTRARQVAYVIAVPGTGRTLALQFTTAIPYPATEDEETMRMVDELMALSDVVVSTFAWELS